MVRVGYMTVELGVLMAGTVSPFSVVFTIGIKNVLLTESKWVGMSVCMQGFFCVFTALWGEKGVWWQDPLQELIVWPGVPLTPANPEYQHRSLFKPWMVHSSQGWYISQHYISACSLSTSIKKRKKKKTWESLYVFIFIIHLPGGLPGPSTQVMGKEAAC